MNAWGVRRFARVSTARNSDAGRQRRHACEAKIELVANEVGVVIDVDLARVTERRIVGGTHLHSSLERGCDELEETHRRLKKYAAEVEDLAVLEERNRLARELHDSVSQAMFGIQLATRSAQILRKKDPEAVPAQLEQLQTLTHEALARMRGFISELRPKS